ncbi:hypothetical protein [Leekyejoonella antrihumi]|nr:hypothetical protein [Leekyejoonella antrihumi]
MANSPMLRVREQTRARVMRIEQDELADADAPIGDEWVRSNE